MPLDWGCHTAVTMVLPLPFDESIQTIHSEMCVWSCQAWWVWSLKLHDMSDVPEETWIYIESICDVSCNHDNGWQFHLWGFFATPLRILRDSWSWAFSSMVSDAFQVDLELRTSTLKGFFVLQEFEENRGHQKHWHKLKLDLFVCVNVQWKFVLWKLWGKIWSASQQFVWWIGLISIRCLGNEGKSQWSQDARMANIGY